MASSSSAASPSAPSFSWAMPDPSTKKASPKPKPLVNPLLSKMASPRQGTATTTSMRRAPFVSIDNTEGLRQRRPASYDDRSNGTAMPPPPKTSLSMGGEFVALNEGQKVEGVSKTSGLFVSWGRNESPPVAASSGRSSGSSMQSTLLLDDTYTYDRWVLVYGYATKAQYESILRLFGTFGKVTSRRGICRPGTSNWVALQYESSLQAEKALCQQHFMIQEGVFIGVTRMDPSLRQCLEWNVMAPPSEDAAVPARSKLDDRFRDSSGNMNGSGSYALKETDVLLLGSGSRVMQASGSGRKSVCEQFLSWLFDW